MAYDAEFPPALKVPCDSGGSLWIYVSSVDNIATIAASGYFANAKLIGLRVGDVLFILDRTGVSSLYQISSFVGYAANTSPVAAGGGGGDIISSVTILSGSVANATSGEVVVFNSASGLPKTLNAPAATGSLGVIESIDAFGDAEANPVTFTPAGGSTVIGGQNQLYTNYGSAKWRDVATGLWANI